MSNTDPLSGLDAIPWSTLSHAYNSATDVPNQLRIIANDDSSDPEPAKQAVWQLFGNIYHQGTVYDATEYAVPFLARLAVAGKKTADLVGLLGSIADREGDDDSDCDVLVGADASAKAAVMSQVGLFAPLLGSEDEEVRGMTAWALGKSGPKEAVVPLLKGRLGVEEVVSIRTTLLQGIYTLDPKLGVTIAKDVVESGSSPERLVAAWIHVLAGLPWSSDLSDAATAWIVEARNVEKIQWDPFVENPFKGLLTKLAGRGDVDAATRLAISSLGLSDVSEIRKTSLWAIRGLVDEYRLSILEIVAAVVPLLEDEGLRDAALQFLGNLDMTDVVDSATGTVLADTLYGIANVRGVDEKADKALECLIELGDLRGPRLLATDLEKRPLTLNSVGGTRKHSKGRVLKFDQGVLNSIRGLLGTSKINPPAFLQPPAEVAREGTINYNMLMDILSLLATWGPQAAPALLEIFAVLPDAAFSAKVLVAIGDPGEDVIAAVRAIAESNDIDALQRLTTANALLDLTGETGPLLAAIKDNLTDEGDSQKAARFARHINDPPGWLVLALKDALTSSNNNVYARSEIARALCHFTKDASVLKGFLKPSQFCGPVGGHAALEAASDLGPAAESLIPDLEKFLCEPAFCVLAVKAIMGAGLGHFDLATLANHLVDVVGRGNRVGQPRHALDLLREIKRRDGMVVSADMLDKLRDLAERRERVIYGLHGEIDEDEALRRLIRDFLKECSWGN
ncbi:hypothetical protein FQN54_002935 [Arachnomyces sp. PD_36]|nr:hypothetical protein FQN54_002935 [Arachnomyces sp. PD_36]